MIKTLKKKKKKGFTLIELIAVVAIIGILAAVLIPRVVGYINDSKQGAAIQQAKNVLHAYNTYNAKETTSLDKSATTVTILQQKVKATGAVNYQDYFDTDLVKQNDRLDPGLTMEQLDNVVKYGFNDGGDGIIQAGEVNTANSTGTANKPTT